jgi:hypothetical protein
MAVERRLTDVLVSSKLRFASKAQFGEISRYFNEK